MAAPPSAPEQQHPAPERRAQQQAAPTAAPADSERMDRSASGGPWGHPAAGARPSVGSQAGSPTQQHHQEDSIASLAAAAALHPAQQAPPPGAPWGATAELHSPTTIAGLDEPLSPHLEAWQDPAAGAAAPIDQHQQQRWRRKRPLEEEEEEEAAPPGGARSHFYTPAMPASQLNQQQHQQHAQGQGQGMEGAGFPFAGAPPPPPPMPMPMGAAYHPHPHPHHHHQQQAQPPPMIFEAGEPHPPFGANAADWGHPGMMPPPPPPPLPHAQAMGPYPYHPFYPASVGGGSAGPGGFRMAPTGPHHPAPLHIPKARPAAPSSQPAGKMAAASSSSSPVAPVTPVKEDAGGVGKGVAGVAGGVEVDARVGLLPGVRPAFLEKYMPQAAEKARRAPREILVTLTEEEKAERRRERARQYSHMVRRRQEQNTRELIAIVEQLTVYRLLVEEASEHVAVLAPDASAALLFANAPLARRLLGEDPYGQEEQEQEQEQEQQEAATVNSSSAGSEGEEGEREAPVDPWQARQQRRLLHLLGKPFLSFLHPEDAIRFKGALALVAFDSAARRRLRCRLKCGSGGEEQRYIAASVSMKQGTQGVICLIREDEDEDEGAGGV